jgi:hypothetical protein
MDIISCGHGTFDEIARACACEAGYVTFDADFLAKSDLGVGSCVVDAWALVPIMAVVGMLEVLITVITVLTIIYLIFAGKGTWEFVVPVLCIVRNVATIWVVVAHVFKEFTQLLLGTDVVVTVASALSSACFFVIGVDAFQRARCFVIANDNERIPAHRSVCNIASSGFVNIVRVTSTVGVVGCIFMCCPLPDIAHAGVYFRTSALMFHWVSVLGSFLSFACIRAFLRMRGLTEKGRIWPADKAASRYRAQLTVGVSFFSASLVANGICSLVFVSMLIWDTLAPFFAIFLAVFNMFSSLLTVFYMLILCDRARHLRESKGTPKFLSAQKTLSGAVNKSRPAAVDLYYNNGETRAGESVSPLVPMVIGGAVSPAPGIRPRKDQRQSAYMSTPVSGRSRLSASTLMDFFKSKTAQPGFDSPAMRSPMRSPELKPVDFSFAGSLQQISLPPAGSIQISLPPAGTFHVSLPPNESPRNVSVPPITRSPMRASASLAKASASFVDFALTSNAPRVSSSAKKNEPRRSFASHQRQPSE